MEDSDLTDAELDRLEGLALQASPAPWQAFLEGKSHQSGSSFIMTGSGANRGDDIELTGATLTDYEFIAAARNSVGALVAEIRRRRSRDSE